MPNHKFLKERLKSFTFAAKGLQQLLKKEANFKVEVCFGALAVLLGFLFSISTTEWLVQIVVIGMVLSAEALNSAMEKLADAVHPERADKIARVKDMAAAAVLLTAIMAVVIGLIIYVPYGIRMFI